jgi:cell division protein FtsW
MKLPRLKKEKINKRTSKILKQRKSAVKSANKKRQNDSIKTKKRGEGTLRRIHGKPDFQLIIIVTLFLIGGLLMIFSASAYAASSNPLINNDTFFYFKKQIQWIILGGFFGYIMYLIPLKTLKKLSPLILAGGIVLLIYILPEALFGKTLINSDGDTLTSGIQMPFVEALNGAPRWINFGFTNLQPSEFVKFGFAIYISAWLTKEANNTLKKNSDLKNHLTQVVLPFLVLLGAVSMLILVQRDFDSTVVLVLSILTIYYVSGTDVLHTVGSLLILLFTLVFGIFALFLEDYRRERVETFWHIFIKGRPADSDIANSAFQVWHGLVGLGSGGLSGNGYGESVIKQGYLQEAAYTDSIFVVIGDEFGFIGSICIIIGFLYFTSIGFNIAKNAKDRFNALLAVGMTSIIAIQAFLNIAAVLVIIPFGGMPLPFFTYGGSTTISTLLAIGVLLNVSKENNKKM